MSDPLPELTNVGAASLTEFDEDFRAARFLADRPLESGDVPSLTQHALELVATRHLLLPDAESLIERCVVGLLGGHVILQGPPGTGKTTLARLLAEAFNASATIETATADWSTYDVIGGLQPTAGIHGEEALRPWLGHVPRAAVRCANVIAQQADSHYEEAHQAHWLILDEFSRAEIDKAIGPLYTVLGGGGERRLPLWYGDADERREVWLPDRFRLIGTMNDVDTSYVYTFSQGLSRRFQFIYVGVPTTEQVPDELRAVALQAGGWHARTYQGLSDEAAIDLAAAAFADDAAIMAILETLRQMLTRLRYDGTDEARPNRSGWPVGTAQLVDVLRQVALRAPHAGTGGLVPALDLAIADRLIPQMSNLTTEQIDSFEEWFDNAGLDRARRALAHLRHAQTTNFS